MNKTDYIFGLRAIIEAIESGKSIDKVLIKRDLNGDLAHELTDKIKEYGVISQKVPVEKLNRITMKNHQGAIALLHDGLTDTRNFGAIARTVECAGADAIIIPDRGSVSVTPDAVKTSAGALLHIPVCRVRSMASTVRFLRECGYKIVGATEKTDCSYTEIDYTGPVGIVMGAEDTGISNDVIRECDSLGMIPILGNIGSLNVSVAAGVMMYEVVRQRRGL